MDFAHRQDWRACGLQFEGLAPSGRFERLGARACLDEVYLLRSLHQNLEAVEALARQKYWQIRTNFTTPSLYVYIVKLYPNDYK